MAKNNKRPTKIIGRYIPPVEPVANETNKQSTTEYIPEITYSFPPEQETIPIPNTIIGVFETSLLTKEETLQKEVIKLQQQADLLKEELSWAQEMVFQAKENIKEIETENKETIARLEKEKNDAQNAATNLLESKVNSIYDELRTMTLWQVDRSGGKRGFVIGTDAQDALRRASAQVPESDNNQILGVRSMNEKVII